MYTLWRLIFHNIGLHLANTLSPRASRIRESWNDGGTGIWTGHLRYKSAVEYLQNLAMILTNSTLFRPSCMQMSLAVFSIAWWRCDRGNDFTSIQFSIFFSMLLSKNLENLKRSLLWSPFTHCFRVKLFSIVHKCPPSTKTFLLWYFQDRYCLYFYLRLPFSNIIVHPQILRFKTK